MKSHWNHAVKTASKAAGALLGLTMLFGCASDPDPYLNTGVPRAYDDWAVRYNVPPELDVLPNLRDTKDAQLLTTTNQNCQVWNTEDNYYNFSWTGPCVNGFAHGQGELTSWPVRFDPTKKMIYSGEMQEGWMEGQGTFEFDGNTFTGGFHRNDFHGDVSLYHKNGDVSYLTYWGGVKHGPYSHVYSASPKRDDVQEVTGQYRHDHKIGPAVITKWSGENISGAYFSGNKFVSDNDLIDQANEDRLTDQFNAFLTGVVQGLDTLARNYNRQQQYAVTQQRTADVEPYTPPSSSSGSVIPDTSGTSLELGEPLKFEGPDLRPAPEDGSSCIHVQPYPVRAFRNLCGDTINMTWNDERHCKPTEVAYYPRYAQVAPHSTYETPNIHGLIRHTGCYSEGKGNVITPRESDNRGRWFCSEPKMYVE